MFDANNSGFRHLLNKADWRLSTDAESSLVWDGRDGTLHLSEELFVFSAPQGSATQSLVDRRAAARDQYGYSYWINATRDAVIRAEGNNPGELWWRPGDTDSADTDTADIGKVSLEDGGFEPVEPASADAVWEITSLCITSEHYLVLGLTQPEAKLLILDLHAGANPLTLTWPAEVNLQPAYLAAAAEGGFFLLDTGSKPGRVWAINRSFQLCDQFKDAGGEALLLSPAQVSDFGALQSDGDIVYSETSEQRLVAPLDLSLAEYPVHEPIGLQVMADNSVLVLDQGAACQMNVDDAGSLIHLFIADGRQQVAQLDAQAVGVRMDDASGLCAHDFVHVDEAEGMGAFFVLGPWGNQIFLFRQDPMAQEFRLVLEPEYYPLLGFDGKALTKGDDRLWFSHQGRWLPVVEQKRPRFADQGQVESRIMDSGLYDCVWHRLIMDAWIPPNTSVQIEARAADREEDMEAMEWVGQPAPVQRAIGAEIPWHRPYGSEPCEGAGSWDLLFQDDPQLNHPGGGYSGQSAGGGGTRGRFLQLRVTLSGNQRATPRLSSLRAWTPRFSYLNEYLPALYRQDPVSASFLDRYLSNIEGLLTTWEDRIAMAQLLMDARSAPADYLPWLANWLGVALDPLWDESRRRLFLRHAASLFRQRGTVAGMVRLIRLSIDECPDDSLFEADVVSGVQPVRVVESFLQRPAPQISFDDAQGRKPGLATQSLADPLQNWTPDSGAQPLHQAWWDWLDQQDSGTDLETALTEQARSALPPIQPVHPEGAALWQGFLMEGLPFTYAPVTSADLCAWQSYLLHRYRRVDGVASVYGKDFADVSQITLPNLMPAGGIELEDWIRFVSTYLPAQRSAHRFSVLVPAPEALAGESDEQALRTYFQRIEQIVLQAKPAHTEFEVQVYSGLCRVGLARLGLDTVLQNSARNSAHSSQQVALDSAVLGMATLESVYPYTLNQNNDPNRQVLAPGKYCVADSRGTP